MKFRFVAAVLLIVVIGAFFLRSVVGTATSGISPVTADEGYRLSPTVTP